MTTTTYTALPFASGRQTAPAAQLTRACLQSATRWMDSMMLDARSRYLAGACNHAELEQREREWDAHQRRSAQFLCL